MGRVPARPASASGLEGALDLLTPPFEAAAGREVLPVVGNRLRVPGPRRRPVLLVRLRSGLGQGAVVVRATVAGRTEAPVVFGPYAAAGTTLPLHVPRPSDGPGLADDPGVHGPFEADLQVWRLDGPAALGAQDADAAGARAAAGGEGVTGPLGADDAGLLLEGVVLEGTLARLVLLTTLEKQRLLAAAREVTAGRTLTAARAGALDAHGADLGVPRLEGEADAAYRARLRIYSSWRLATPAGFEHALNGPGGSGAATGLPAGVGVTARFRVVPPVDHLAVAVRLVEVTGTAGSPLRPSFETLLSAGLLMDLHRVTSVHLPTATRTRLEGVRRTLRVALVAAPGAPNPRHLGVLTAVVLERLVRYLAALTGDGTLEVVRSWRAGEDPRHELGLALTLRRLDPVRLDAAADAVRTAQAAAAGPGVELPGVTGTPDPELLRAVLALRPRSTDDDPSGEWLFAAAGMRTVVATGPDEVHVSPVPTGGLAVEGPGTVTPGADLELAARVRPDAAAGRHVLVAEAATRAEVALGELGAGQELLPPEDLLAVLEGLRTVGAPLPASFGELAGAGLAPALPGALAARVLEVYDLDLLCGFRVDVSHDVPAGTDEGAALVRTLTAALDAMVAAGFHSVRALPVGDGVVLLGALSVLPGGANRPGEAPPAAYRWYVTELPGRRGTDSPVEIRRGVGGRVTLRGRRPGLALVVCVAYVRKGLADPYEVRVELADDTLLTLDQYGYVMNLLEHLCPLGIEINTFDLRRNHVTLDGSTPTFLSSAVSRSYVRYRRRRRPGVDRHTDAATPPPVLS